MNHGPDVPPLRPGENCWRVEQAEAVSVIIDAADYFRFARSAMLKAQHRIMLIGWDFDARITLDRSASGDDGPQTVGAFISWLVERNPSLEVYLLRWDMGAVKSLFRGTTVLTLLHWLRHPRIHTRLDSHHPPAASHHQKIVAIDDCFAFCGGIDMTGDRWDRRVHEDGDPGRVRPNGKAYGPWHDATTAITGAAAAALGEHARTRWHLAGGAALQPVQGVSDCWPTGLAVDFPDVQLGIARTAPEMDDCPATFEIEQLYLDQIAGARKWIYAESQYFASRRIAEAMAKRLDEADGPEIVLINPQQAEGWLEPLAMDTARARLVETLRRRDRHGRLRIYHPFTAGGEAIYAHAKIMIIDDRSIRVGSSNLNNRSMRLDTECDVTIDTTMPDMPDCAATIDAIRNGLIAEHLGVDTETVGARVRETGSLIATIEGLRGPGKTLRSYETPDLNAVEAWLAENEVLDPEGPGETFEGIAKGGLRRRLRFRRTAARRGSLPPARPAE